LKVLLVNLLAALNFANVYKKHLGNKKRDQNKNKRKNVFYIYELLSMKCALSKKSGLL